MSDQADQDSLLKNSAIRSKEDKKDDMIEIQLKLNDSNDSNSALRIKESPSRNTEEKFKRLRPDKLISALSSS